MVRRSLSVLLLLLCFWGSDVQAMGKAYQAGTQAALRDFFYMGLKYRKGGLLKDGFIDCSKLLLEAMRRAGIPGLPKHIQAWMIYEGKGIWRNEIIPDWDTGNNEPTDVIFQHFKGNPAHLYGVDHVVIVFVWKGVYHIIHASSSAGTVVIRPMAPWVAKAMVKDGYRRLRIGDKR